jgi:hypothetical protein
MKADTSSHLDGAEKANRWFFLTWLLVSLWVFACAIMTQGEYGDGYQTIVNGRYFFADSANYFVQRGPLAGLALWPVEALRAWIGWGAIDVRPYHVYSGILHSLYLIGCWYLLKRTGPDRVAEIIAFVAAILSVVFYANAPYLSHDIIPGLLFLLLIFLCNRWLNSPDKVLGLQLVLLGTAVTLIKQTYALFWVALVLYTLLALVMKWDDRRVTLRKTAMLLALAGFSGILSWLAYGLFIANDLNGASVLSGPLDLMKAVSNQYGSSHSDVFTADLYFQNLHNYGIAALLMVIPGLIYAFRASDARLRMIAVCWVICALALQFVSYKEVRYLAFLAPLTAVLIVPIVQTVMKHRLAAGLLMIVILFDQYRGLSTSAAQLSSTAGVNVSRFLEAPDGDGRVIASKSLSFVYMAASPMPRDPYHGIYHITPPLIRNLNEDQFEVIELGDPRELGLVGLEVGDRVYFSNTTIVRKAPWRDDNVPSSLASQIMVSGDVTTLELVHQGDKYVVGNDDDSFFLYVPSANVGQQMPVISGTGLGSAEVKALYGEIEYSKSLTATVVAVKALCQADRCEYR